MIKTAELFLHYEANMHIALHTGIYCVPFNLMCMWYKQELYHIFIDTETTRGCQLNALKMVRMSRI